MPQHPENVLPALIIPAYNPDQRLVTVVNALQQHSSAFSKLVIVNDGSESSAIFGTITTHPNLIVLSHPNNLGKGAALKTGLRWVQENLPNCSGAVTADADGQHLPDDIIKVAKAFAKHPQALWLGCRDFKAKHIPFRSWLGNTFARYTFALGLRIKIPDTQTGLRGIPSAVFDELVQLPSNRYEFELDMLIVAKRRDLRFQSTTITTVYEPGNTSSHFKPLQDSIIIYKNFLKFSGVGIASAALDYGLFALVYGFTGEILLALALARLVSGVFNFTLNRQWVFKQGGSLLTDATKYTALAATLVLCNYGLTKGLTWVGISPFIGKPIAEIVVFLLSYGLQKKLVFR
ncbi:bifunctional glycosyltransferase family 2/GtrA family protein [Pseudidiomarina donghaiensis]|uniref:Glycosyltransferase n=1 Tax=Pseudidiomarina donghaiensis TaxID=519452 RepID=A0A432XGY2_9GAMM|nr:bifunctional glycosyltransferase family 2/GtrA family protein [Pseudidiomarina donghaiensis]RUO48014.1 glycosyltransferase [Pseudidiomarina donghaiensis]SFV22767.1 Glycosyltransferase involved in cell wall bisynthesis [Pseudidiomarina donghaiensis]